LSNFGLARRASATATVGALVLVEKPVAPSTIVALPIAVRLKAESRSV
jgi:hypothetical protein